MIVESVSIMRATAALDSGRCGVHSLELATMVAWPLYMGPGMPRPRPHGAGPIGPGPMGPGMIILKRAGQPGQQVVVFFQ